MRISLILLLLLAGASFAWWDASFPYRTQVNISSTSALSDYQVAVNTTNLVYNNTGLVGSWHFSEGAGTRAADSSGKGNDGALTNSPAFAAGKSGNGLQLNGVNQYIDVGNAASLNIGTNPTTFEFWMRSPSTAVQTAISTRNENTNGYVIQLTTSMVEFYAPSTGGVIDGSVNVLDGAWHHVAVVRAGVGNNRVYVDGVSRTLTTNTENLANPTVTLNTKIGMQQITGDYRYFNGTIDEVRIYNRSLSASEVQARYNSSRLKPDYSDLRFANSTDAALPYWLESDNKAWVKVPSIPTGTSTIYAYYGNASASSASNTTNTFIREISGTQPVKGAWNFDNNAQDQSGNNNNGTLNGGMTYTTGKFSQAGQFDGVDESITFGDPSSVLDFGTGEFTETYWIYPNSKTGDYIGLIYMYTPTPSARLATNFNAGNLYVYTNDANWHDTGKTVGLNAWSHIAWVKTGTTLKLYINGTDSGWSMSHTASLGPFTEMYIGRHVTIYPSFNGKIDEARIYGRALTQAEITDLYNNYGYVTTNYPGRELVRKYAASEPVASALTEEEALEFAYRKEILLSNAGSALTDYQVNLTINTSELIIAGKMKSDCSDLRFTNSTSYAAQNWAASYSYWIESGCNTGTTNIWVKVPSVPNGASTIYAYHGNASAGSASSWASAFPDTFTENWQEGSSAGIEHNDTVLDTFIDTRYGVGLNHGNDLNILLGSDAIGSNSRGMIKFNISPYVKRPAVITAAALRLTYLSYHYGTPAYRLHRTIATFDNETYPTWTNFNAQANWDATIIQLVSDPGTSNPLIFNNADFVALLNSFVNGTYANNGFYIKTNEPGGDQEANYYSSEHTPASNRPKLTLSWQGPKYAFPEPTATEQQPDTTAPVVQIQFPISQAYLTATVPVNFTIADDSAFSCTVRLNGVVNSSTCSNYTLFLSNGAYTLNVSANDTSGNEASSQVAFTIAVPTGQSTNTTQATTGSDGVAAGTIGFTFTPASLQVQAGGQIVSKPITASAGVNRITVNARVTLSGQPASGKQVTYTLSGPA